MKKNISLKIVIIPIFLVFTFAISCKESKTVEKLAVNEKVNSDAEISKFAVQLSKDFKDYWYSGKAEISSFALEQARYGELRKGHAILVYVTEPFLPDAQVKADQSSRKNISVLKLNSTKNFLTGIYPYSVMTSTFYPVQDDKHALKISTSVQEWCGHVYTQLNNRKSFEVTSHSYFQGEADRNFTLDKAILENELWNKIRINPDALPVGEVSLIPSLEYFRMTHTDFQAFPASLSLEKGSQTTTYTIRYTKPERTLTITFNTEFPHEILGWTDRYKSGFGPKATMLTSKATRIKTIKSSYWQKNSNADVSLRDSLGL